MTLDLNTPHPEWEIKLEWKGLISDEEEKEQMEMLDSLKVMDFDPCEPVFADAQSTAVTFHN